MGNIIYKITNLINNKIYIGQTTQKLYKRWGDHCSKDATCKAISAAISKYGKQNFSIEPILSVIRKEDLNYFETYFIKYYNSFGIKGYNLSLGEEGNGSEVLKKSVIGYNDKTNTSFYLNCINQGSRYKFDPRAIQRCLKTSGSKHHGYFWFYSQEFNDINLKKQIEALLYNTRKRKNSTSKYKGVSWSSISNKWFACIEINKKTKNLGFFNNEIDAKNAYIKAAIEVYHR